MLRLACERAGRAGAASRSRRRPPTPLRTVPAPPVAAPEALHWIPRFKENLETTLTPPDTMQMSIGLQSPPNPNKEQGL